MHHSSKSPHLYRQPSMSIDEYRSPRQSTLLSSETDRSLTGRSGSTRFDAYAGLGGLVMKPDDRRSPRSFAQTSNRGTDRTLSRLITDQPINPTSSRLSHSVSLKSLIIDGRWNYRPTPDDHLRMRSMGIEHLVNVCHDIMKTTAESLAEKRIQRKKSPSKRMTWPIVNLQQFENLSKNERTALQRSKCFNLMTIVYQAASTSASMSELVRIWREVKEHHSRPRPFPIFDDVNQPKISYPIAIGNLIRNPHDQIFQIALHAALISTHSPKELRRLGDELGVDREQFDIRTIRHSIKEFQDFIHYLRAQRLIQRRKQFEVKTNRIPSQPKKKRGLQANLLIKRFPIVRQAVDLAGFTIHPESDFTCDLLWIESSIPVDMVSALKPYQKVNQFLQMNQITQKDFFVKNYKKLSSLYPQWFDFLPKTWVLPHEHHLWHSYASKRPKKDRSTYILKPIDSKSNESIEIECDYSRIEPKENHLIQEYIREPFLFHQSKFDIRLYVLVTSCDPLRCYIFDEGLVRFSPQKYEVPRSDNHWNLRIHSTHHSLNLDTIQDNLDVEFQQKQTLASLFAYLHQEHQEIKVLWKTMQDIVIKTLFIAEPHLWSSYRKSRPGTTLNSESVCFELLSFEFLLDQNCRPWLIEVNRPPEFDIPEQIDFDLKIKLLLDAIERLDFRPSNRGKSVEIEKIEAQNRLYATLGKSQQDLNDGTVNPELIKLKEDFSIVQNDHQRYQREQEHPNGFLRLFPVNDPDRMNELIPILKSSFETFDPNIDEQQWKRKYSYQYNETELFDRIARLESRSKAKETSSNRSPSPLDHSFQRPISTQTPSDIERVISSSSTKTKKKTKSINEIVGVVSRPSAESTEIPPGVSANRIQQKKFYKDRSSSAENNHRERSSSVSTRKSTEKSQMVTEAAIIRAIRSQSSVTQTSNIKQKLRLNDEDFDRLNRLIFDEMMKFSLHYPNKNDRQTKNILNEIIDQWEIHQPFIARYWFVELDTPKREAVIEIVWNNLQNLMKKVCLIEELTLELPLNRHLLTLKRRLLANNGQTLWDSCLNRHHSWESLFIKSTHHLSTIELDCCYRFVELCQDSLFIVYRYSQDQQNT